ncbi:uncharacterized protein LOC101845375 isoform X2 [Aplysia californica]|uniref:Uncharacterized protein LOC101845375 isoform X2 n=1 Tax=Aplysia californica TaxID=6500 RepID=A0ABM0JCD8_APLCA|nr:uncharacterized protein LOC101845375 isoform X2 [Aplysia californica]
MPDGNSRYRRPGSSRSSSSSSGRSPTRRARSNNRPVSRYSRANSPNQSLNHSPDNLDTTLLLRPVRRSRTASVVSRPLLPTCKKPCGAPGSGSPTPSPKSAGCTPCRPSVRRCCRKPRTPPRSSSLSDPSRKCLLCKPRKPCYLCSPCKPLKLCNPCDPSYPCKPFDTCWPSNPCRPSKLCDPCRPSKPCNPCRPSKLCDPCRPSSPCNPCRPTSPCDPCWPSKFCDPCSPCRPRRRIPRKRFDPCNPCDPCKPWRPRDPCDPCDPSKPWKKPCSPCDPCQPGRPCDPCNPSKDSPSISKQEIKSGKIICDKFRSVCYPCDVPTKCRPRRCRTSCANPCDPCDPCRRCKPRCKSTPCKVCKWDPCTCTVTCSEKPTCQVTAACPPCGTKDTGPSRALTKAATRVGKCLDRFTPHMCPWEADVTVSGTVRGHCTSTAAEVANRLTGCFKSSGKRYTKDSYKCISSCDTQPQKFRLCALDDGSYMNFSRNNIPTSSNGGPLASDHVGKRTSKVPSPSPLRLELPKAKAGDFAAKEISDRNTEQGNIDLHVKPAPVCQKTKEGRKEKIIYDSTDSTDESDGVSDAEDRDEGARYDKGVDSGIDNVLKDKDQALWRPSQYNGCTAYLQRKRGDSTNNKHREKFLMKCNSDSNVVAPTKRSPLLSRYKTPHSSEIISPSKNMKKSKDRVFFSPSCRRGREKSNNEQCSLSRESRVKNRQRDWSPAKKYPERNPDGRCSQNVELSPPRLSCNSRSQDSSSNFRATKTGAFVHVRTRNGDSTERSRSKAIRLSVSPCSYKLRTYVPLER